jgi:hypothetical protein
VKRGERLARAARMTIVEQHAIADENFTADGHAGARVHQERRRNLEVADDPQDAQWPCRPKE